MTRLPRRIAPLSTLGGPLLLVLASSTSSQLPDLTSDWQIDRRDIFSGLTELSNANLVYNASSDYAYGIWFCAVPPLEATWRTRTQGDSPRDGPPAALRTLIDEVSAPPPVYRTPLRRYRRPSYDRPRCDHPDHAHPPACGDPIYYARSRDGAEWEVYAGDGRWTTSVRPWDWQPVVDRGGEWYDNGYAAHPSVVFKDGTYYMAYSSLGTQERLVARGQPGHWSTGVETVEGSDGYCTDYEVTRWVPPTPDRHVDDVRACIMGATSSDGIRWDKTPGPIAIAPAEHLTRWTIHDLTGRTPPEYQGAYQRPCLLFDEGRWRLWYAYYLSADCIAMGYRENRGDFTDPADWDRGFATPEDDPLLEDWPNPSVVRAFGRYYAFSDRGRYSRLGNRGRVTMAESDDGFRWRVIGTIRPEGNRADVGEPEACFTDDPSGPSLRLFYTQAEAPGPGRDPHCTIRVAKRPLERRLLIPRLLCDWRHAIRLADPGGEIESFSLFGQPGRWYCIAADADEPEALFMGTNDRLSTRFAPLDPATEPFLARETLPGGLTDARQMRGLSVRLLDPVTPLLCFGRCADGPPPEGAQSRMETLILGRDGWTAHGPERPLGARFLFQEDDCRDPMIIWDPTTLLHLMYYVGPPGGVQARTSPDLMTWSDPRTVVACPPGYGTAEAPFVVQKEGYYYLFVSSEDHSQMAVYASLDPLDFGDAERDLLVELPGHAPEIVRADGVDYIACCSTRSDDGPDQKGVYLQELAWVE